MKLGFQDLQDEANPNNGATVGCVDDLFAMFDALNAGRSPFMCELAGENGFVLTVGIGGDIGCVQHAPADGSPPYLMAKERVAAPAATDEIEFLVGDTPTPIEYKYCLPFAVVKEIVADFMLTGGISDRVAWEEI